MVKIVDVDARTHDQVMMEWISIMRRIEDTPNHLEKDLSPTDFQKAVDRYHEGILLILDSGVDLGMPSELHREAHQYMWVIGHMLYERFKTIAAAAADFTSDINPHHWRERFNVWYAKEYIGPAVEAGLPLGKQMKAAYEAAQRQAIEVFHHPLEQITKHDLGM